MGAICRIIENNISKRTTFARPAQWLVDFFTGGESASGIHVTEDSALKHTPFWSAVRIISGTCGSLPFITYRRIKDGKERQPDHRIYKLLHDRPNPYMDALTFIESRQAHVLTYGNGYAEIQRDGADRPVALWPLMPNKTVRKLDEKTRIPYYELTLPDGNTKVDLPDYNVLHIKGLGFDGYTGYDVVSYHKDSIGYGIAVKEFGARFFANDASPGGILEHPNTLKGEAFERLKKSWAENHQGLKQSHRMQILEEGMKFNKIGVDPEQAQALEVQKWTVDDCSRIFQIPPHMLASMEHSKYNNVEQLELEFLKRTMLYWFRKWECECNYKLFMPSEQGKYFVEILYEALLRGDIKTRYECYNIGRTAGFLCVDDIRQWENLNPLPDGKGKIFLEPLNMVPAGSQQNEPNGDRYLRVMDIFQAHKDLFVSQWSRIITKQLNASARGTNGDFLRSQREYAQKLLAEPVNIWASINRIPAENARAALSEIIETNINANKRFEISDSERLADMTMARIGGDNAAT